MHIKTKILNKTAGLGKDKTCHKSVLNGKLCFNMALLHYFSEHKVSLEIITLDTDTLRPVMHTADPKLCVSLYIKRSLKNIWYVIWPSHVAKLVFLNYISVLISPTKFHREDRGTSLTIQSQCFSTAVPRFSAENTEMEITTNTEGLTLSHMKRLSSISDTWRWMVTPHRVTQQKPEQKWRHRLSHINLMICLEGDGKDD